MMFYFTIIPQNKSDLSHNLTDGSKSNVYSMCSSSDTDVLPDEK